MLTGAEKQDRAAAIADARKREADERMVAGYNLLRDALSWFSSHEVEKKLGHLPQWVPMARNLTTRKE